MDSHFGDTIEPAIINGKVDGWSKHVLNRDFLGRRQRTHMVVYGEMTVWRDGSMERWQYGEMAVWRDGSMERWQYGEMTVWRDDCMER